MAADNAQQEQDQNTAKLVMSTFYKVANTNGTTAADITRHLQDKFGDVWKVSTLMGKAEETLKRNAVLGFLERHGDQYVATLTRELGCGRRKRRRRRSCRTKRRRHRSCKRKRRRRRSCCCTKK